MPKDDGRGHPRKRLPEPSAQQVAGQTVDDGVGPEQWRTAVDGTSRIYLDQVRVACQPARSGWWARVAGDPTETGENDLRYPVHGWLRRGDQPFRLIQRSDRTVCGLRLADMRWRDLLERGWLDVGAAQRCPVCAAVLDQ